MSAPERDAIAIRGVDKDFPGRGGPVHALRGVTLRAAAGEVTGLVGPDGAGKTTLVRLCTGLLLPDAGELRVAGLDPATRTLEVRDRVGYMPQKFGLYQDLTVQENLDLYSDLQGVPRALRPERYQRLTAMTGLGPFSSRLAGRLSGGMKQKLGLACALVKSPEVLVLDEPTVGVDPVSRRELWRILEELVGERGIGILVATAYLDEADRCDRVVVLDHGEVLGDAPPAEFRAGMRGRVQVLAPGAGWRPRRLQVEVAEAEGVIDATIRSGRVRVVARDASVHPSAGLPAGAVAASERVEPVFEDAFLALLPGRHERVTVTAPDGSRRGAAPEDDEVVVRVTDLRKRFGDFEAVRGIGFEVRRGEIYGLLGPNGAGKSTTFRMLCGLLSISGGEASVAGKDLRRSGAKARARLGYMAQQFSLYGTLDVLANLRFFGTAYGLGRQRLRDRIDWALEEFHLAPWSEHRAGTLPGGYKQRLAMAAALLHEPEILFLDEPTSGVDPIARREFWQRINAVALAGTTIVVTTHFMEEAEHCDRMLIMSGGSELASGTPDEIRALARDDEHPEPTIEDAFVALATGREERT